MVKSSVPATSGACRRRVSVVLGAERRAKSAYPRRGCHGCIVQALAHTLGTTRLHKRPTERPTLYKLWTCKKKGKSCVLSPKEHSRDLWGLREWNRSAKPLYFYFCIQRKRLAWNRSVLMASCVCQKILTGRYDGLCGLPLFQAKRCFKSSHGLCTAWLCAYRMFRMEKGFRLPIVCPLGILFGTARRGNKKTSGKKSCGWSPFFLTEAPPVFVSIFFLIFFLLFLNHFSRKNFSNVDIMMYYSLKEK